MFRQTSCSKNAFTLVEVLIVVAVLGVLATIVVVAIDPSSLLGKARNSERINDLKVFERAAEGFMSLHGRYPEATSAFPACFVAWGNHYCIDSSDSTTWIEQLAQAGFVKPDELKDPRQNQLVTNKYGHQSRLNYMYVVKSDLSDYKIYAYLEEDDELMANDGGICDVRWEVGSDLSIPAWPHSTWGCEGEGFPGEKRCSPNSVCP